MADNGHSSPDSRDMQFYIMTLLHERRTLNTS